MATNTIKRNERDWAGQLISWIKSAIEHGTTVFEDATNDTGVKMESGRTKFPLVTYGSDPGDEYWEAKAMTVMITLKGFVKLEELSRKKRDVFKRYGHFYDNV